MMSKTHIAIGTATSLAICAPTTVGGIFSAVMGGMIGGILCDIECRSTPKMRDALHGRVIVAVVTAGILLADWFLKTGIWNSILSRERFFLIFGAAVLLGTCTIGRFSDHRTFTHSLLFVLLIDFGCFCIIPDLLLPVLAGGLSHLFIDTLNKKPVPWLYPIRKNGICFKLCYADNIGNAVLMWLGVAASTALLFWRIIIISGKY